MFNEEYSDSEKTDLIVKEQHAKIFRKYDKSLDSAGTGPTWLTNPEVADIIQEAFFTEIKTNMICMHSVLCRTTFIWFFNSQRLQMMRVSFL